MPTTLLFGGSFDPVHLGHLHTAAAARTALAADSVLFIPAAASPHKTRRQYAPAADRLAMIRLAIANHPHFAVTDLELTRPAPSYTIDTLESLHAAHPATTHILLLGADQLPKLHTWHRFADILPLAHLAILPRPDCPPALPPALLAHAPRITFLDTPLIAISSTQIRTRAAAGEPLTDLVPPDVAAYIQSHALYRQAPTPP